MSDVTWNKAYVISMAQPQDVLGNKNIYSEPAVQAANQLAAMLDHQ